MGNNIVSTSQLYAGTYNLFAHSLLHQEAIEVRMFSGKDCAALDGLIDERTKAVFCESIGNPAGNVVNIAQIAAIVHHHGVPVIVYYHTDIGYVIGGDMLTSTIRQVSKWQNISRQNLSSKQQSWLS
ncbi:MAG: aminotransferase class I/II-fold pyridoxal phosphate-dependent enzyme, partial [Symbiopectobacterium sp.]